MHIAVGDKEGEYSRVVMFPDIHGSLAMFITLLLYHKLIEYNDGLLDGMLCHAYTQYIDTGKILRSLRWIARRTCVVFLGDVTDSKRTSAEPGGGACTAHNTLYTLFECMRSLKRQSNGITPSCVGKKVSVHNEVLVCDGCRLPVVWLSGDVKDASVTITAVDMFTVTFCNGAMCRRPKGSSDIVWVIGNHDLYNSVPGYYNSACAEFAPPHMCSNGVYTLSHMKKVRKAMEMMDCTPMIIVTSALSKKCIIGCHGGITRKSAERISMISEMVPGKRTVFEKLQEVYRLAIFDNTRRGKMACAALWDFDTDNDVRLPHHCRQLNNNDGNLIQADAEAIGRMLGISPLEICVLVVAHTGVSEVVIKGRGEAICSTENSQVVRTSCLCNLDADRPQTVHLDTLASPAFDHAIARDFVVLSSMEVVQARGDASVRVNQFQKHPSFSGAVYKHKQNISMLMQRIL